MKYNKFILLKILINPLIIYLSVGIYFNLISLNLIFSRINYI